MRKSDFLEECEVKNGSHVDNFSEIPGNGDKYAHKRCTPL